MEVVLDAAEFHQRLAEAIAWCSWRLERSIEERRQFSYQSRWHHGAPEMTLPNDLKGCLRSTELKPSYFFNYNTEAHLKPHDAYRLEAVDALAAKRSELLRQQNRVPVSDGKSAGGRILVYEPDHSLWDGPSGGETDGYIEVTYDVPPWDSWVCFVPQGSFLLSYVPPALVALVDDGISVCASGCIFWLDSPDPREKRHITNTPAMARLAALMRS